MDQAKHADTLRILLVVEAAGGGSGRHVLDLAMGLIEAGHDVTLAYSSVRAERWFSSEANETEGLGVVELEMQRAVGVDDFRSVLALRRHLKNVPGYDVIHGHSSKAGAVVRLACLGRDGVTVYTPHAFVTLNPTLGRVSRWVYAVAERLLAPLGDGVICVSEEERRHALALGIMDEKLFVVDNGVARLPRPQRRLVREGWGLTDEDVVLGFVGRMIEQKAVHRMISLFSRLHPADHGLYLVLVGSGPLQEDLQRLAKVEGIDDRVIFNGPGNGPALMAGFDLFVLTSLYEGFPYVFLEATARGLPIVTTRVGGAEATVDDGVNGYVIDQDDMTRFVERVLDLAQRPDLRERMSAAARERGSRMTADRMVKKTIEVYRRLIELDQ